VSGAGIRPLEAQDLPAIAALYERIYQRGTRTHDERFLREVFLEGPATDPEIPSLVYTEADGRPVGFIGATVTPMRFGQERIRMVTSSHLLADPRRRTGGVGGLLQRAMLAGPQELTITDTATPLVARMWRSLGGSAAQLPSITWLRILNPWRFVTEQGARLLSIHAGRLPSRPTAVDRVMSRWRRDIPPRPRGSRVTALSAELMHHERARVMSTFKLVPDYDITHLDWLLRQARNAPGTGELVANAVLRREQVLGWFVYRRREAHVSSLLQLAARPLAGQVVVRELLNDARDRGISAIQGPLEARLVEYLAPPPSILRLSSRFLAHSRRPDVVATVLAGRAMISRLDGEWW
jgi:L-amino acid N-acyltransferase YncA